MLAILRMLRMTRARALVPLLRARSESEPIARGQSWSWQRLGSPVAIPFVALAALLCACAPAPPGESVSHTSTSVTNGAADTGDAAVGAIGMRRATCEEPFIAFCSGTLIAPRVVLTAAHCVERRASYELLFGDDTTAPGDARAVVDIAVHPAFDDATNDNDIALLLLDSPVNIAPSAIADAALDSSYLSASARVVGFGVSEAGANDTGLKRQGNAVVAAVRATSFDIAPDPAMSCQADSGGPVFVHMGGKELLAGITSFGDAACSTIGTNTQVGAYGQNFIAPFIDNAAAAALPEAGPIAAQDVCREPCAQDGDCPAGMTCERGPTGSSCAIPGLGPGTVGPSCSRTSECSDGVCARLTDRARCGCYTPCFGEIVPPTPDAGPDASPAPDSALSAQQAVHVTGGCSSSTAPHASSPWPVVAVLLLGSLAIGRRRRSSRFP